MVKHCNSCQCVRHMPPLAPLTPWIWPGRPWKRVHVDFGEKRGRDYLVLVDAYSKWPEIVYMPSTSVSATITALRGIFSRYGLPESLVSDNGPQFRSSEFSDFLKQNGIKQVFAAPYHPPSKGTAERFVDTFKQALSKGISDGLEPAHCLANFLNVPQHDTCYNQCISS